MKMRRSFRGRLPSRDRADSIRPVQHRPHFASQGVHGEGLLEKLHLRLQYPVAHHRVVRVARHEQHPRLRMEGRQPLGQLPPAHPRHYHIGYEQVDWPWVLLTETNRFLAVGGYSQHVAVRLESQPSHRPYRFLIFNQENRLGARQDRRRLRRRQGCGGDFRNRGKVYLERRAVPDLAVDANVPAALLNNSKDGRQTQPGSLAYLLGREERLEDAGLYFLAHATAGVAHRQQNVAARLDSDVRTVSYTHLTLPTIY